MTNPTNFSNACLCEYFIKDGQTSKQDKITDIKEIKNNPNKLKAIFNKTTHIDIKLYEQFEEYNETLSKLRQIGNLSYDFIHGQFRGKYAIAILEI